MKQFLFFILLSIPISTTAQNSPYKSLVIQDNQVIFQQVYDCRDMSADSIMNMLSSFVPTIKSLKDYRKEGEVITGVITNGMINFRKYGGRWGNTVLWVQYPFTANISFMWKDKKYRVTATNIVFHTAGLGPMELTNALTRKGKWDTRPISIKGGEYVDNDLAEMFTARIDNW